MLKLTFLLGFFAVIARSAADFSPNVKSFTSVNTNSQMHVQIAYINMDALKGYILDVPPIKTIITEDIASCQKECIISTAKCLSINLVQLSGGGYNCSILSDDIYRQPWKKISKEGAMHLFIMNKCVSGACQSPNVCIPEYEDNTYSCHSPGMKFNPATSCRELYATDESLATGLYWIRFPQDVVTQALCDMTIHDGKAGWLLIANITVNNPSDLDQIHYLNLDSLKYVSDSDHVSRIAKSVLESNALYPFTKIRIKCYKQSVGKILHIVNSDTENGKYLFNWGLGNDDSRKIQNDPSACADAIVRLPDDDNLVSKNCDSVGPSGVVSSPDNFFRGSLRYQTFELKARADQKQLLCGDDNIDKVIGYWYYYFW